MLKDFTVQYINLLNLHLKGPQRLTLHTPTHMAQMWRLWRDPRGEKIFTQAPQTFTSPGGGNGTVGGTCDLMDDKVSSLQRQVKALQLDLARCRAQVSGRS